MCNAQLHECQGEKSHIELAFRIGVETMDSFTVTVVALFLWCACKPMSYHLSLLSEGVVAFFPIPLESPGMR